MLFNFLLTDKPDCTGGMDTTSDIVEHVDYTALPGSSRGKSVTIKAYYFWFYYRS